MPILPPHTSKILILSSAFETFEIEMPRANVPIGKVNLFDTWRVYNLPNFSCKYTLLQQQELRGTHSVDERLF